MDLEALVNTLRTALEEERRRREQAEIELKAIHTKRAMEAFMQSDVMQRYQRVQSDPVEDNGPSND
jgi:hypothetical protein